MKKMIRYLVNKIQYITSGKIKYQRFYSIILDIAIKGLNYKSGDFRNSGELEVIDFISNRKVSISNIKLFDVGANEGWYSLELVKKFKNNKVEIFSFEPSKHTYNLLKNNVEKYKNISAINIGFSNSIGKKKLFLDNEGSLLASFYQRDLSDYNILMKKDEDVIVTTIDTFCLENGIDKIDFLKIDVEGHELNVLLGAERMLKNNKIDYIQFEFGEANIDSRVFLKDFYMILSNYCLYRIVKNGIVSLNNYREEYEIFRTINFLAIRNDIA